MNGLLNENVFVKEYDFKKPHIKKIDSVIDNCIRDCHHKNFLTFDHICEYDNQLTNITDNETVNFPISQKSMASYELNKNLTVARGNGYIINQIKSFKKNL